MLGDRGAAVREKQRVRQEAVETQRQTRQDTMSTLADSVAEDVGGRVIAPTRRERREAAVTLRNERRATKMAEKAKRREERILRKGGALRSSEVEEHCAIEQAKVETVQVRMDQDSGQCEPSDLDSSLEECLADHLADEGSLLECFYEHDGEDNEAEDEVVEAATRAEAEASGSECAGNRKSRNEARARERQALKAARAREKEALRAMWAEERQKQLAAKAERRRVLKEANARGKEAFRETILQCQTPAGRGRHALACSGIDPEGIDVVVFEEASQPENGEPHVPGQLVAIDHKMGCVVVALRGSSCLRDALVDLDCKPETITLAGQDGLAHGGMLRASQKLAEPLAAAVETALMQMPEGSRRVLVVGHSLGAGVAALLTAMWHEDGVRLPATEIRCLAFACPQVLDSTLASAQAAHTLSIVVGEDCVPCLSLATCFDLRDALVLLAAPEARGLDLSYGASDVLATAAGGDSSTLASRYREIRELVGTAPNRLFPSGRLIKHVMGEVPRHASHHEVDEMVVTPDMVAGHMPHRYLASACEIAAAGSCTEPLWTEASTSLISGVALALLSLPSFTPEEVAAAHAASAVRELHTHSSEEEVA